MDTTQFRVDPRGRGGLAPRCTPCLQSGGRTAAKASYHRVKAERPERMEEIRQRQRERAARERHGEDGLAVHRRRERGDGCDACGDRGERMAIDHDHATEEVRGLLCPNCNTTLGLMGDSPARLRALAAYVEVRTGRGAELGSAPRPAAAAYRS